MFLRSPGFPYGPRRPDRAGAGTEERRENDGERRGNDRGTGLGGLNLPLGFPQRAANGRLGKLGDMRNTTKLTIAAAGLLAVVSGGGAVAFAGTATPTPAPSGTATTPAPVNETPGT